MAGSTINIEPWTSNNPIPNPQDSPTATITVGTVTLDDNDAVYSDDGEPTIAVWSDYMVRNRYESDKHVFMMPTTAPAGLPLPGQPTGQSVAFCQLASQTILWVADWTACRVGVQPDIPTPDQFDPLGKGWITVSEHVEPAMITVGPDGVTPIYRISGTYVFGCANPDSILIDNVSYGRPAWMDDILDRSQPSDSLTPDIIEFDP